MTVVSTVETSAARALASHTTLRLGGPALRFGVAESTGALVSAVHDADAAGESLLLLGGGSNLVVADAGFDGGVCKIATTGVRFTRDQDHPNTVIAQVAAGEDWDEFVARAVDAGLGGLECLSGIPGCVGATPIQNVGAYGWEIAEFVRSVDFYDRRTGQRRVLGPAELAFGYRTSALKGTDAGVVLGVRFALHADGYAQPVRYAELARTLGVEIGTRVPVDEVRAAVLGLRRGKGMLLDAEDHDTWSAGSFFTNPIVGEDQISEVLDRIAAAVGVDVAVPQYPAEAGVKLSAAWLIERAGFGKGYPGPGGRVSLSHKHTLALTNRGCARTADLLELARQVCDGVASQFGVRLRTEPLLINCRL